MNIYVAHSRAFDYEKEIYEPIKRSALYSQHTFILPHEHSDKPFSSKEYFKKGCDLVLTEVSHPSTGMGIELGWASTEQVRIACLHQRARKPTEALRAITDTILE